MAADYRSQSNSKRYLVREDDGPNPKRMRKDIAQSNNRHHSPDPVNYESPAPSDGSMSGVAPHFKTSSHSKKERKNNRSTRIHSLRKQLARGSLPQIVHRDKERELAALLLGQEKDKLKQQSKKNLKKYHYVRFLERQKAEKKLKQLRSMREKRDTNNDLDRQIHEMEVNLNYSIYAPLGQKYVSVFPKSTEQNDMRDEEPNRQRLRINDTVTASNHHHEDLDSIVTDSRSSNKEEVPTVRKAKKPPLWYEVERAMIQGQEHLEALRDGRGFVAWSRNPNPGKKEQSKRPQVHAQKISRSEPPIQRDQRFNEEGKTNAIPTEDAGSNSDEDMSDGGFFER